MSSPVAGDAAPIEVSGDGRPTAVGTGDGGRQLLFLGLGALVVAILGAGAFFALSSGTHSMMGRGGDAVPVIHAADEPFKQAPQDPGGIEVPNRDKLIYSRLRGIAEAPEVERLLPGPEQPLPPPQPAPSPPAAQTPAPLAAASPGGTAAAPAAGPAAATANPPAAAPSPDTQSPGSPADTATTAPAQPPVASAEAAPADETTTDEANPGALTAGSVVLPVARPAHRPEVAKEEHHAPIVAEARSEPAAEPAFATKAGAGRFQVQLGAMSSPELARAQWTKLLAGNPGVLGRLQPSITPVDLGERGTLYRLRAGPIDGPERAEALCKLLSGRSVGCVVVSAGG